MIQFYFLSVLVNACAGCVLFFGFPREGEASSGGEGGGLRESLFPPFARNETFRFALGIAAVAVGVLKLLSPIKDDVPFFGDIFPAVAGMLAGFALMYEHVRMKDVSEKVGRNEYIKKLLDYKTYIGIVAMVAAALHFLFPAVVVI